jgi:hypothetical protein
MKKIINILVFTFVSIGISMIAMAQQTTVNNAPKGFHYEKKLMVIQAAYNKCTNCVVSEDEVMGSSHPEPLPVYITIPAVTDWQDVLVPDSVKIPSHVKTSIQHPVKSSISTTVSQAKSVCTIVCYQQEEVKADTRGYLWITSAVLPKLAVGKDSTEALGKARISCPSNYISQNAVTYCADLSSLH